MRKLILMGLLILKINSVFGWEVPVIDLPNLVENILTAKRMADNLKNQAKQIKNEIDSLKLFTKNSKQLSQMQWRDMQGLLFEMDNISKQGKALSFSMKDLGTQFNKIFPDIDELNTPHNIYQKNQQYKKQQQATRDTLKNNLLLLQKSAENFDKQQQTIEKLKSQSQSAEGHMQALQIASEIAAENINQLQEMKKIMAAQANASNVYMSHQLTVEAQQEKDMQDFVNTISTERYKPTHNFGKIAGF